MRISSLRSQVLPRKDNIANKTLQISDAIIKKKPSNVIFATL